MKDQLFQHILDGLKQSIERSRFTTTLLIIACVLCSIAYWNGKENSWGRARMSRYMMLAELDSLVGNARVADSHLLRYKQYVLSAYGPKPLLDTELFSTTDNALFDSALRRLHATRLISDSLFERISVPWISKDFVDYLSNSDEITPLKAEAMRQALTDLPNAAGELSQASDGFEQTRRAYIRANLFVDLPFFGLAFDLNDLALLSGLGFTLLLLALVYNLLREHHNLETLIDWVKCLPRTSNEDRCIRLRIYQAAANFNVLTMPPQIFGCSGCTDAGHDQVKRVMRFQFLILSKAIYLIPVILHATVRHNDILTRAHGFALQPERLHELETQSTFFLVTISILTVLAMVSATRIELLWVTFAGKVRPGPSDNPKPCTPQVTTPAPTVSQP